MLEGLHEKGGVLEMGTPTDLLEQIMADVGPKLKKVGFEKKGAKIGFEEIREEKKGDKSGFSGGGTGN